jgi:hypothetical protein
LELLGRLDLAGGGFGSDVEKINVGLQETLLHKFDGLGFGCNFLFKLKVVFFFCEVSTASRHVLFVLAKPVVQRLFAVFLDDLGFSFIEELVLLLSLGFFLNLTDF